MIATRVKLLSNAFFFRSLILSSGQKVCASKCACILILILDKSLQFILENCNSHIEYATLRYLSFINTLTCCFLYVFSVVSAATTDKRISDCRVRKQQIWNHLYIQWSYYWANHWTLIKTPEGWSRLGSNTPSIFE